MILIKQKSDTIGAISSALCLIHCMATPFLFIAQSCAITCNQETQLWWQFMDYFFLMVSLYAIYQTTKKTSNNFIKPLLWISWLALLIIIINEKLEWFGLNNHLIYVPTIALILLHIYNLNYCKCSKMNAV